MKNLEIIEGKRKRGLGNEKAGQKNDNEENIGKPGIFTR